MAGMSDYLENLFIDHLFRAATWSKPGALYIALFTANPTDAGGGTEVAGGSYARVQLNPSDSNWNATQGGNSGASSGSGGQTANSVAIVFPSPSADWGTVTGWALFDASSGGNLLVWGTFSTPKAVLNGDAAPQIAIGGLVITAD